VLGLVRSIKNSSAVINKIPPVVLSLIPEYWVGQEMDENLIKLTHVCHGWRELFTSRPSLWTRLDFKSVDKTKVYIERSKPSPLEIYLKLTHNTLRREEALVLAIPHIARLGVLSVNGNPSQVFPALVKHFSSPVPSLRILNINIAHNPPPLLPENLFNGHLSSLRELSLGGVITGLPWRGMLNLTTFNFRRVPGDSILMTQLLDFLESAPHLRYVKLHNSIPNPHGPLAEKVVSLPRLKELSIITEQPRSVLLGHISIPVDALLRLEFIFSGLESPIPSYLPNPTSNLRNLSHTTAMNLCFGSGQRSLRLNGPSGELYMLGNWKRGGSKPYSGTGRFLYSLDRFDVSKTRWLAITSCDYRPGSLLPMEMWCLYKVLRPMEDLRTLTLARCNNLNFISILNPDKTPSNIVVCPKLGEIVLYIERLGQLHIEELLSMTEERASRGVKLPAITIVSAGALAPTKEVFQLRKHVSRVECKFDDAPPAWDALPATWA